jgi:hypothetical protein
MEDIKMKIYTREKFMELPSGTIFAKGKPWYWGTLHIKHDTIIHEGKAIDFVVQDLISIEAHDSGQWSERQDEMLEAGASYPLNEGAGRDGCFDDEDLFLVYEIEDLTALARHIGRAAAAGVAS